MKSLTWKVLIGSLVLLVALVIVAGVSFAKKGEGPSYSPKSAIGMAHIEMYSNPDEGSPCDACHVGPGPDQPKAPVELTDPNADMKDKCCSECHPKGGKPDLFISHMKSRNNAIPTYCRCSDCHKISGGKDKSK
jgi:hypothetical protein